MESIKRKCTNFDGNIIKKRKIIDSESDNESDTKMSDSEIETENETETDSDFNPKDIKNLVKKMVKKYTKKISKVDSGYDEFNNLISEIYDGDFFERVPLEIRQTQLKETFSKDEILDMTEQLSNIKKSYENNSPSIVDIIKMNVPIEQKKKLLEKVHCLVNSDILTDGYTSNLKYLTSNISCIEDPDLLALEEKILKHSSLTCNVDSYRTKILKSRMSFDNKIIAYRKLEIMEAYEDTDTSEYAKYKGWIDTLLSIPFGINSESDIKFESIQDSKNYIKNVRNILDEKLSFLEKPKDQIINIVTQTIRNPDANINAIGLYGGAGLGKTEICKSIAKALNRPFASISLGGESDASSLTGHGFTYIGSNPGRLIDIIKNTKTMNPVILFDELDKLSETQQGKEIIGTLIHLTDSTTNNKYNHDKYFSGIEFDLSKVLFIFTYNDPSKVDKILADRLFKINVENYTFKEKLEITNKHIIPHMLEKFKFNHNDVTFSEEAIKKLVNSSNKSYGMRDTKTKINILFSRINTLLLTDFNDNIINLKYKKLYPYYRYLPINIPVEHIEILLDESISTENKDDVPMHMYV